MKLRYYLMVPGAVLLAGCSHPAAAIIVAINHTKWAINHFSVDGQSAIDAIGPYQGGGGGGSYIAPAKWQPGLTVKVDWETGVGYSMDFPGYADEQKFLSWAKKIKAQNRQHSAVVPVPDYTGQKTCGITLHFMPCDEVKVTTSCVSPGRPGYPINEPLQMPEPKVCPK